MKRALIGAIAGNLIFWGIVGLLLVAPEAMLFGAIVLFVSFVGAMFAWYTGEEPSRGDYL